MIAHRYNWQLNKSKGNILIFRVSWNRGKCSCKFSSQYKVNPSKWVQEAQRCKANSFHPYNVSSTVINRRIDEYENIANSIFSKFYEIGAIPTVDEFKLSFNTATGRIPHVDQKEKTICELFNKFTSSSYIQNSWAESTLKKHRTIHKHLLTFNDKLRLCEFDKGQMRELHSFFIKMEFNNSYIERIFKVIKQFIKWAKENYGYTGDADTYRIRKKNVTNNPVVYLNWDELQNLYNSTITNIHLQQVKDVFCFCCFTSLRYSDVAKLQRDDITESQITIVTKKTSEAITIELNSYSKSILDKYKDIQFKNNLALPVISNQKMNIYLKQLAKENGLCTNIKKVYYTGNKRHEKTYQKWELITTHCGRRTFIVNALFLGIPAEVVMKWTGHADYTAMKPYIHIVDELKSREMEKFNRR